MKNKKPINLLVAFVLTLFASLALSANSYAQVQPPTNVTATNGQLNTITISWNLPSSGAPQSYNLFRSSTNELCSPTTLIAVIPGNNLQYVDTSFPNTNAHYYSLRSVAANGDMSACSNSAAGSALGLPPPRPPSDVAATQDLLDKVVVTWNFPTNTQDITSWRLFRTTQQGLAYCEAGSFTTINDPNIEVFEDIQAELNVTYYYALKSVGPTGISNCSDWVVGRRLQPPPPSPPDNINATDGDFVDRVRVTWVPPSTGGAITKYNLFRSTSPGVTCSNLDLLTSVNIPTVTFDDMSAVPGVVYHYRVESEGPHGKACGVVDPGFARLSPPRNINATDGLFPDKVDVTWLPPQTGTNISGYRIFRNNDCSGTPLTNVGSSVTLFSDTTAVPGVIYDYSIQTVSSNQAVGTSACGPFDPGHASLPRPTNVSATDGAFPDKVDVSWNPPPQGTSFDGYRVFRNTNCSGQPVATLANNINLFSDFAVTPGVIYDYTVQLFSNTQGVAPSQCSLLDPGHAALGAPQGVSATDGDFPDRVVVSWNPNPNNSNVGSYRVFRNTNCSGSPIGSVSSGVFSFPDFGVTPGVVYQYSLQAVSNQVGISASVCSLPDPGHASILPPPLDITTSSVPEGLKLSWTKPEGNISGYQLYRSDTPGVSCSGSPIATLGANTLMFVDENIEKGKTYFYSILATSPVGNSGCSPIVSGFLDREVLLSPAFAKFNTYLGQWNFAELINQGSDDKPVRVSVFNLRGELMTERTVVVKANQQVDVNVNEMVQFACDVLQSNCEGFEDLSATAGTPNGLGRPDGVVDTYGLVRFEFDDSNPNQRLVGRMSFYRPNTDGSYSFAFAREFRNPLNGTAYGISNTHDPRGMGFLVPNWAELISFGIRDQSGQINFMPLGYTIKLYDQTGTLKSSRHLTLQPLGEFDLHGGHEFVGADGRVIESVYLVEVIPDNPQAEFFLSVARYSSNAPQAVEPETYNYALVIDGQNGSDETIYAPIGNRLDGVLGLSDKIFADNWVEVACTFNTECEGVIRFLTSAGSQVAEQYFKMKPKEQFHFNASAILPPGSSGSVHIIPFRGRVISQSMTYINGDANQLQTAFVSPARLPGGEVQSGTINTFLGMQNVLNAFSIMTSPTQANYSITSFRGGQFQGALSLSSQSVGALRISDNSALNFPANTYGALRLTTASPKVVSAEVRRVRVLPNGSVDFVMPTLIK